MADGTGQTLERGLDGSIHWTDIGLTSLRQGLLTDTFKQAGDHPAEGNVLQYSQKATALV